MFTILSLLVSLFAFGAKAFLAFIQRPEFDYLIIVFITIADTIVFYLVNAIKDTRYILKELTRRNTFIYFICVVTPFILFVYFLGGQSYSVLLSISLVIPISAACFAFIVPVYIRREKLKVLNRAIKTAGHN